MPEKPVSFFGRLALRKQYVTPGQLQECVSLQLAAEEKGAPPPRLGELLVRKGYMTEEQVREILAAQQKTPPPSAQTPPAKMVTEFAEGEVLFREGDEDHRDLYILLEGRVTEEKNGILLNDFSTQGAFLGPIATLLKTPRATTAVAKTTVKVFRVPEENVDAFFRNRPAMALRLSEVLAERLDNVIRRHAESARTPPPSAAQPSPGESGILAAGGPARLAEDEKGRLVLRDIRMPEAVFVNGYPAGEETILRDQDNVQIGRHMLQVFYEHAGLIPVDQEEEEKTAGPAPDASVPSPAEDDEAIPPPPLPDAAPPPGDGAGADGLDDDALRRIVDETDLGEFSEEVRQAVNLPVAALARAEELDDERRALLDDLPEDAPDKDDVKREIDRQRREAEKPPPGGSLETAIEKLETRLNPPDPEEPDADDADADDDEAAERQGPPPLSDAMRRAYALALRQKKILLEREQARPALLETCGAAAAAEPLYRILAKYDINPQPLFGWAVHRLGLEDLVAAHNRKLQEIKKKREDQQPKKKGILGLVKREDEERAAALAQLEEDETRGKRIVRCAQRELRAIERDMVNEFWRVYEAAAQLLIDELARADEPFVRAFLRRAVLGVSRRFLPPDVARPILVDCNRGCAEPAFGLDAMLVFYPDEAIELSARGKIPASPNEDLELNHRNSPMWKADRALRKIVNSRIREQLLRETLTALRKEAAAERQEQEAAEKRLELVNPGDRKRKEKLSEIRHEIQRHKVEAGRKERLAERIDTALLPRLVEEGELARNSLDQSGMTLKPSDLVKHEVSCTRRFSRLVAKLKEPFLPFSLRDTFKPAQGGVNDRAVVEEAIRDAEERDPILLKEPLVPVNRKQHRTLVRYAPVVALTPCAGIMGFMIAPRGGIENGRFVLPGWFGRADERQPVLWEVLSDFRYDTSKASAGVDIMNSETLVAAYAEVRWNLRKKDREVRQKAAIYTEENERTNWRRHYALYMKSAHDAGKLLFFKCPELYEMVVPKYVELPEGLEVLKRT